MADCLEAGDGLAANPQRGAIGRAQLRVLGLQGFQFVEQPVELAVGDLRLRFDVVLVVVVVEEPAQLLGTFGERWHISPSEE
jgi:hypothetical protein